MGNCIGNIKDLDAEKLKEERNRKAREAYNRKNGKSEKYQNKLVKKEFEKKYKGFEFAYDGTVISFEVKLPFRIIVEAYGTKRCDDKKYAELQSMLKRRLRLIDNTNSITILECGFLQYFTTNVEKLDEVCMAAREFIKEQLSIYGQYVKGNHLLNTDLQDDIADDEK